jgi:hypothetical protein
MSVLLLTRRHRDLALDVNGTAGLADLGVDYAAIFGHGQTLAVVLDGVRFDPRASARTAVDLIAGHDAECIELQLIAELTLAHTYGPQLGKRAMGGGS